MHVAGLLSLVLATVLLAPCNAAVAQSEQPDKLVVTRTEAGYQLRVPVSRLEMLIPEPQLSRDDPEVGGSTDSPRYFNFIDSKRGLVMSGWFEPANLFHDLQSFWSSEVAAWRKQGLPEPANVATSHVGNWQVVLYDMPVPGGKNLHVRAHWVQAGTWIDLHISLTGTSAEGVTRKALLEILEKITVTERHDG